MDSQSLRCFLRIAELGSFGRASQVLNVSQPTLTRRIAVLERELQARLFIRHQRGITLTPAGVALNNRALNLVRQLDEIREDVSILDREPSGSVAVGLPPSLIGVLNGPLVETYCRKFPRVSLSIYEGINNWLEEKMINGDLDIAIMLSARAHLRNITVKTLATEGLFLVGSGASESCQKAWVTIPDIADTRLILSKLPNYIRWRVDVAFQQSGLAPKIVVEANTLPMLLELARRGVGSVVLPKSALISEAAGNRLKAQPIRGMSLNWVVAISRDRALSPAVNAMAQSIESLVQEQIKNGKWQASLMP